MDAFAVALGLSLSPLGLSRSQRLRLALAFGSFQFLMPLLGWLAGTRLESRIRSFDHWVAFGLLVLVGGKMIVESFRAAGSARAEAGDPTRASRLLVLAVATSIDALAVGLSLGVLETDILYPAAVIGAVAFLMTIVGARLGPVLGKAVGRRAEILGGIVLVLIGVKILADHLSP
ncbi:MAG: manganese efflux pump [Candidatus Aminicenantes bacterium]|nr:manganese efflux pump [Candidatus Aminicenantes bacterium]